MDSIVVSTATTTTSIVHSNTVSLSTSPPQASNLRLVTIRGDSLSLILSSTLQVIVYKIEYI